MKTWLCFSSRETSLFETYLRSKKSAHFSLDLSPKMRNRPQYTIFMKNCFCCLGIFLDCIIIYTELKKSCSYIIENFGKSKTLVKLHKCIQYISKVLNDKCYGNVLNDVIFHFQRIRGNSFMFLKSG